MAYDLQQCHEKNMAEESETDDNDKDDDGKRDFSNKHNTNVCSNKFRSIHCSKKSLFDKRF